MTDDQDVREAARRAREADELVRDVIRQAHRDGWSLRELARASGYSHEGVRKIVRSEDA